MCTKYALATSAIHAVQSCLAARESDKNPIINKCDASLAIPEHHSTAIGGF